MQAQLSANFTIDKAGGCSPLTVQFTNTTTGASPAAVYKWDLGNGNTSGLANPGATYVQPNVYSVTLTVTDSGKTSTKTEQVTVYNNPTVDFSATPLSGCLPLNVAFTSNVTPGDGTISNYFWDFGDGQTQTGANDSLIAHTYTFAQTAGVGLTVTNSYGCYSTASKSGFVTVSQPVTASFAANQTVLCQPNNQVTFTNNSTGPGTILYKWDFGDGQTSTSTSPAHTYVSKGIFTVTLTASSSAGCTNDTVMTNYINVADFIVDFSVPRPLCTGSVVLFADSSTPSFNSTAWLDNGQLIYNSTSYDNSYRFYFTDTATHILQLTHTYGTCTASKTDTVKASASPALTGFAMDVTGGACTAPITVNFSDTSNDGAVKWVWSCLSTTAPWPTGKSVSYSFSFISSFEIGLQVTNSAGCRAFVSQQLNFVPPYVTISATGNGRGYDYYSACTGATIDFSASPADVIKGYQWNFGDGSGTDTSAAPAHKFTSAGTYTVLLNYTTITGCTGTASYGPITILDTPSFSFTASPDSVICGNTQVTFTLSPQLTDWFSTWSFGDNTSGANFGYTATHQYTYDSVYTVSVVVQNQGCADTVTKTDYITVKPDFPFISGQQNTCNGTRGLVTFEQASTKVNQWVWDFGDGSPKVTYNTETDTVYHTYTKTGTYNVVLTGINGACSVGDSLYTYVLLKQSPQLSSLKSSACGSDNIPVLISGMDANPAPYYTGTYYTIFSAQYGDSSQAPLPLNNYGYNATTDSSTVTGLKPGESEYRVITQSEFFYCFDTTNFIPLKIHGPTAGFQFVDNSVCFKSPVVLQDTSVGGVNVPITTWNWNFGDGTALTENKSATVSHIYAAPGQYQVSLTVTDTAGCTNTTPGYYSNYASVSGPQAGFTVSQNTVPPNTTVYFYNSTNTYNAYSVTYTWLFPDGSQSQNYDASFLFIATGTDTVKLISSNNQLTCVDTAYQIINVRTVNTAFTYSFSYINNNNCPPVIVTFTSTTNNASGIYWIFGDGSTGGNQSTVSHTYDKPGLYRVVLYGYDANNNLDSTVDFITVKGPYATMGADKLTGCDSLTVVLSAVIRNASSFTWDFGDGTLQTNNDTFAVHQYLIPGIYTPQLILKDSGGCAGTSALANKIIVDTLSVAVVYTPTVICDSAMVYFTPTVSSIAVDELQLPLQYHWYFGTGNAQDTSNLVNASFGYGHTAKYGVSLTVSSPYGCVQTATDSITVQPVSRASITGPADVCVLDTVMFNATVTNLTNTLIWDWSFFNNATTTIGQGPVGVNYIDSGAYNITLIINNNGCYDTAYKLVKAHGRPLVNILPQQPNVCLGNAVQITAHDAQAYVWQPNANINNDSSAAPFVNPSASQWYYVQATNVYGCTTNDSVWVKVNFPFKLKADSILNLCFGSTGQFNVSGAASYTWISGAGLSNTQIPNPFVNTTTPQTYTVVGYDSSGCFTDTANIQVFIIARPSVTVTPQTVTINAGTDIQLLAQGSADVVQYAWQPIGYLSCTNCASPLSSPKLPVVYTVTVTNSYGCTATDTVKIDLFCSPELIYIPNAFTPNGDGINDRFVISGNGVKLIKHIAIYGRLGEKVFERGNIGSGDTGNSWDGTIAGEPAPTGVYVYMAVIECATGETYNFKGTVVLIR